jgi:hypothetical protein
MYIFTLRLSSLRDTGLFTKNRILQTLLLGKHVLSCVVQKPNLGLGRLFVENSRSHH